MLILTGPTAAGKNSIAKEVAKRLSSAAIVDFDLVRSMFVKPHWTPWDGVEGLGQQRLGIEMACDIAKKFASNGYFVIILDVLTFLRAGIYLDSLAAYNPKILQILPTFEENKNRFYARGRCLTDKQFISVYQQQSDFDQIDSRIDNTKLSPTELAEIILTKLDGE